MVWIRPRNGIWRIWAENVLFVLIASIWSGVCCRLFLLEAEVIAGIGYLAVMFLHRPAEAGQLLLLFLGQIKC